MSDELHTLVCVKVVPKSEEVQVDREKMTLDRGKARSEINPPDMNALEMALALKDLHGGRVSLLAMGPPFFAPYLRVGLAMGADAAYLLSDRAFGGADTLATSLVLAAAVRKLGDVDLVLCGEESSDGATAQVPPGVAAWLEIPQATYALTLTRNGGHVAVRREVRGGEEELDVPLPAVVSVKVGCNEPRFMDPDRWRVLGAGDGVAIWTAADLSVNPEQVGLAGSPTSVAGLSEAHQASGGRRRRVIAGSPEEEAHILYEEISQFINGTGAQSGITA